MGLYLRRFRAGAGPCRPPILIMDETDSSGSETAYPADVLNTALELSTEWGENYKKPIDGRMLEKFPDLSGDDLERLKDIAQKTESFIYALGERELDGQISEDDIVVLARQKYPWLNDRNLYGLKSIGMFYARK